MAFSAVALGAFGRSCIFLLALAAIAAGASGCTTAPGGLSAFASTAPDAQPGILAAPEIVAVTTRNAVNGARSKPWFGTQRANQASNVATR